MGELSALKQLLKARELKPKTLEELAPTAAEVGAKSAVKPGLDINKPYKVRTSDGTLIPFNAGTPVEKAKQWTKNFYRKDLEDEILSATSVDETEDIEQRVIRPKTKIKVQRDEGEFEDYEAELMYIKDNTTGEFRIRNSFVNENARGGGIGTGMYRKLFETAKEQGGTVVSDSRLSADAVAIWKRMKAIGYPIIEYPMEIRGEDVIRVGSKREHDLPLFEYDPKGTATK
jgi:predicted GNAT family acetyltransferase